LNLTKSYSTHPIHFTRYETGKKNVN